MMKEQFVIEIFRHGFYKRRRVFRSREAAVAFVNDFQDDHCGDSGYQLQLVHNGRIEQFGINGNNR